MKTWPKVSLLAVTTSLLVLSPANGTPVDKLLRADSRGYGPTFGFIPAWGTEYISGVADLGYVPYLAAYDVSASLGASASEPGYFHAAPNFTGVYSLSYDWSALLPASWVQVSWQIRERPVGPNSYYRPGDELNPLTSAQAMGTTAPQPSFYEGLVNVGLQAIDPGSAGVAETMYRYGDQFPWQSYRPGELIQITGEGIHDLYFGSWDNNGNIEEVRNQRIKIDNNNPEIAGLLPQEQSYYPHYNADKQAWEVTVTGQLRDTFPAAQELGLAIDLRDPNILDYTVSRPNAIDGNFTVNFTVQDHTKGGVASLSVTDAAGHSSNYRITIPDNGSTGALWAMSAVGLWLGQRWLAGYRR